MAFKPEQKVFLVGSVIFLMLIVTFYSLGFLRAAEGEGLALDKDGNVVVTLCEGTVCYPRRYPDPIFVTALDKYISGQINNNVVIGTEYGDLVDVLKVLNENRAAALALLDKLNKTPKDLNAAKSQQLLIDAVEKILNEIDKKCEDLKAAIDKLPEPMKPEEPKPIPPKPMPMPTPPANPMPPVIPPIASVGDICANKFKDPESIDYIECVAKKNACDKLFAPIRDQYLFDSLYGQCKKKSDDSKAAVEDYIKAYVYEKSLCPGKTDIEKEKCENAKLDTKLAKEALLKDCGCGAMGLNAFLDLASGGLNYPALAEYVNKDIDIQIDEVEKNIQGVSDEISDIEKQIKDKQDEQKKIQADTTMGLDAKVKAVGKITEAINNLTTDLNGKIKELAELEKRKKALEDSRGAQSKMQKCVDFFKDITQAVSAK